MGKMTAFISTRGWDILGPNCHTGLGDPMSMVSVVAVAGLSPPRINMTGS